LRQGDVDGVVSLLQRTLAACSARNILVSLRRGKIVIDDKYRLAALADGAHLPTGTADGGDAHSGGQ
jgi:hypothetical protein